MDLVRVVADTQVSTQIVFLKMLILSHGSATFCEVFNEGSSSETDAKKKLVLRNSTNVLVARIVFPGRGLRLQNGFFLTFEAGEIWYGLG